MKRPVSWIVLTLLLVSAFALAFDVTPVGAAAVTVYINSDGSVSPSSAPISTPDNITYTLTGNISYPTYNGIIVQRNNIVINGNGYTVQGNNSGNGLSVTSISNVTIKNTNIQHFQNGIYLSVSSNDIISGNTATANNASGISIYSSSNNTVSGNNATANSYCGILLYSSSNYNTVSGNTATNNSYCGVYLDSSSNYNTVSGNIATTNSYHGILLYSSSNNTVSRNIATTNSLEGIYLTSSSSYNTVSGNTATANQAGIMLYSSSNNIVSENIATANVYQGVELDYSSNNIVKGNTASANSQYGILFAWSSSFNTIYHNNFMNNTYQGGSLNSTNTWDNGYPSGGNYWSDYNGTDLYSGPYQNVTGNDGIGDTQYIIDGSNRDHYPLMKTWNTSGGVVRVPEDFGTIQAAINAASPGDTISIAPGVYHESIVVNKTVTILGRIGSEPIFAGGGSGIAISITSSGVIIAGIAVTSWDQGIVITGASNCKIYDTIMSQMNNNGIAVTGTTATNNLIYSNIFQNDVTAINLTSPSGNTCYKNIIINNVKAGITLQSNGNTIYANTISANNVGINLTSSIGNTIYHNDFTGNTLTMTAPSGSNTWDNGYPSGGNYWSNTAIVDLYSGPYQNISGSDGINDTAYTIAINNVDRYPLTKPFNQHNIGITSLYMAKTVVMQSCCMNVSLRILNYGMSDETFNVNCTANTTLAGKQPITVGATNFATVTLVWNTTGFAKGNYTMSGFADVVPGETDMSDNSFTGGWVFVSMLGDLTGGTSNVWDFVPDGKCDGKDVSVAAKCFGSYPGCSPPLIWNSNCDVNNDGKVDGKDIATVAKHFGEHS